MSENKVATTVYAESTPNPKVMKFVANRAIIQGDSVEFMNIDEAMSSPLAIKLFHFPFIKEVFIAKNFVSLTKYEMMEWEDVVIEIREFIREYLAAGGVVVNEAEENSSKTESSEVEKTVLEEVKPEELGEVETRIVDILEEYVAPAVESDGGNIKFISYEEGKVSVLLQGACSGCPSSTVTLKQGIESILKKMLPTLVTEVVAING
ncbi:MAG: NifU family protein [Flavobacteriales bacterium]|jgi:Fe-S cluster biogenesis protein NfuA|tara:strand:- start:7703 stop:8323 length:621 start_codon:yes stop_codon:yes gene_type:complete